MSKPLTVRLPESLVEALKSESDRSGVPQARIVREALTRALEVSDPTQTDLAKSVRKHHFTEPELKAVRNITAPEKAPTPQQLVGRSRGALTLSAAKRAIENGTWRGLTLRPTAKRGT